MINIIPLTVMVNVDGSGRSKTGEIARIIEASDVCGVKLDLEVGTEGVSAHIC